MYGSGSVLGLRILIHKAPEYGSNTHPDPDPQQWYTLLTYLFCTMNVLTSSVFSSLVFDSGRKCPPIASISSYPDLLFPPSI